jgi:hypothetical protein
MALGRHGGGGHRGGGGGFRRGGGFSRGGFGPGPWYDGGYGPLVIVQEDDEDEKYAAFAAGVRAAQQSTKGLGGIFRPNNKIAHPLGAATGPVPSSCWDAPGFKDCQGRVFAAAQSTCSQGQTYPNAAWATYDDCVKDYTATFTGPSAESATCVNMFCPKAGTASGTGTTGKYPWNTYSADTLALQKATNVALKAAGYCPIGEDGKLGAGTCGARETLQRTGVVPGMTWPSTCQKFTAPGKPPCASASVATYRPPVSTLPATTLPPAMQQASMMGGGFNWKTAALIGGGVVAAGLVFYFVRKKQAEAA